VTETDARVWPLWLRINRVLRVMPHARWSAEAWSGWSSGEALELSNEMMDRPLARLVGH